MPLWPRWGWPAPNTGDLTQTKVTWPKQGWPDPIEAKRFLCRLCVSSWVRRLRCLGVDMISAFEPWSCPSQRSRSLKNWQDVETDVQFSLVKNLQMLKGRNSKNEESIQPGSQNWVCCMHSVSLCIAVSGLNRVVGSSVASTCNFIMLQSEFSSSCSSDSQNCLVTLTTTTSVY